MIKIPCGGFYLDESLIINENDELSVNSEYIQTIAKPSITQVTLLASGWNGENKTQTVAVSGVSADENAQLITPTPVISSQTAYYESGILCTGQAVDSLTFTCKTVPTEDLTVYVVIQEVTQG